MFLESLLILTSVIISFFLYRHLVLESIFKKLIIILDEVKIVTLKLKEGEFNIKLIITNTANKTIGLGHIEYILYGNGYEIGKGKISCNLIICPRSTIILNTLLEVKDSYGAGQIWASCKWRIPVYWKIRGTIYFKRWFGLVSFPFVSESK